MGSSVSSGLLDGQQYIFSDYRYSNIGNDLKDSFIMTYTKNERNVFIVEYEGKNRVSLRLAGNGKYMSINPHNRDVFQTRVINQDSVFTPVYEKDYVAFRTSVGSLIKHDGNQIYHSDDQEISRDSYFWPSRHYSSSPIPVYDNVVSN